MNPTRGVKLAYDICPWEILLRNQHQLLPPRQQLILKEWQQLLLQGHGRSAGSPESSGVGSAEKQGEKWDSELKVWLSHYVYRLGTPGVTIWIELKESLISTADTEQICSAARPHWKPPCVENVTKYQATWPNSESFIFLETVINLKPFQPVEFDGGLTECG